MTLERLQEKMNSNVEVSWTHKLWGHTFKTPTVVYLGENYKRFYTKECVKCGLVELNESTNY